MTVKRWRQDAVEMIRCDALQVTLGQGRFNSCCLTMIHITQACQAALKSTGHYFESWNRLLES